MRNLTLLLSILVAAPLQRAELVLGGSGAVTAMKFCPPTVGPPR